MLTFAILAVLFLFTVTFHEICHGYVAYWRGDPTAKEAGRLSLNPFRHIDLFWTILFPGLLLFMTGGRFAIGMAKPVPVNFGRLQSPRTDMMLVALAGPLANLFFALILNLFFKFYEFELLLYFIYFNLGLMIFNLLPIPPLDGSRILAGLLPGRAAAHYLRLEPWGFLIVFVLYLTGMLFPIILPIVNIFCGLLDIPPLYFGR